MNQPSALYHLTEEIRKSMPHPLKPQIKALAAFSVGIAKAERGLNAAAKKLPLVGNPIAVARGIRRFIANGGIDLAKSRRAMALSYAWKRVWELRSREVAPMPRTYPC